MHTGTDAAAPAEGAVAQIPGILSFLEEALRPELVRFGEVGLVEMDCSRQRMSESRLESDPERDLLLHSGAIMVLPLGINMPLYTSSAVLACGVPPSTATGRHRSVSETTALTYSSDARSSNVGSRSLPTTLSSSSCALGMKLLPNLTHARRKLAREPADWNKRAFSSLIFVPMLRGDLQRSANRTYGFHAGAERRPCGVGDLQICHAQVPLLVQEVLGKAVRQHTRGLSLAHVVHEPHVHLNVLLALLEHLGLPGCEDARDVLERRVALDGILARYAWGPLVKEQEPGGITAGSGAYLTEVSLSIDSAFIRTTASVRTSSTLRPYVTVTMTEAA